MTNLQKRRLIREGKRKIDHHVETKLIVKILRACTIDDKNLLQHPNYYKVIAWTDPGDPYTTQVWVSKGNYWKYNTELVIPLDFPAKYLYLELFRKYSCRDPATSDGDVAIGRAKIRLPTDDKFSGAARLVDFNSDRCIVDRGTLELSLELIHTVVVI
ncbi:unnamed protein product [Arabidopsis lyrata]|uniref:C2 domain-containing protein n=1 Tax=Arabidopsis lyrata subsp. lyrata TaxID=81972 RepID=D7LDS0_ARALL|nr:uncharacterized protein LOC9315885 [Arabidopsis lyrata subsp. lyrata]EFH57936.1 hypothetical protein ARALYDRAFT_483007 [Arabidopsis lyrata subsp. lyrata]CAH8265342.1 unnamed protein product [Arabidopsis lyrata]|eukprot:XP_002881677.1 uncharacterized protein LOC9315885 [Arabidopsis lyrata subsp. lyrata]